MIFGKLGGQQRGGFLFFFFLLLKRLLWISLACELRAGYMHDNLVNLQKEKLCPSCLTSYASNILEPVIGK
jgi:hypothetical protein